jgi:peptidoglycan/LPS O-acetylase OafA/YrhL
MFDTLAGQKGEKNTPTRFYSLDVLRGLAALAVVLYHWQHFFYTGSTLGVITMDALPLSRGLTIIYSNGWMAVELFFALSGFVFYWLYSKKISEGSISLRRFSWLRFTRLYPLHFATLIMVIAGQWWMTKTQGDPFVYQFNDIKHFVLNLFFISSWGLQNGNSFNGPIWSVSIEVLLYCLFYLFSRKLPIHGAVLLALALIGLIIQYNLDIAIGKGMASFFIGGSVYMAYKSINTSRYFHTTTSIVALLAFMAWLTTIGTTYAGLDFGWITLRTTPFFWRYEPYLRWIIMSLPGFWAVLVLFPLTILSLSLIETWRGSLGRRISFIGDISYSSYLLHFPLQLAFAALVAQLGLSKDLYYSPWLMLFFFSVLIIICFISYNFFEKPIQNWLRRAVTDASSRPL